jgi:excisionase family DNA binding protein
MTPETERFITAREVATWLNVHPNYVYKLVSAKAIPSYLIGGNRRFSLSDIERWLAGMHEGAHLPSAA